MESNQQQQNRSSLSLLLSFVLFFNLLLPISCLPPTAIDCSSATFASNPKCKIRNGVAKIDGAAEFSNILTSLIQNMDKLDKKSKFDSTTNSYAEELSFLDSLMKSQQKEIDHVAQTLYPLSQRLIYTHLLLASHLRVNATAMSNDLNELESALPEADFINQQQKLNAFMRTLNTLKNKVETAQTESEIKNSQQPMTLIQQSNVMKKRLQEAFARLNNDVDQVEDNKELNLLEIQSSTLLTEQVVGIIEEVIESIKLLREAMRNMLSKLRANSNVYFEFSNKIVDEFTLRANFFQSDAVIALSQVQSLRNYLRDLTASQYTTLNSYISLKKNLRSLGGIYDETIELNMETLPLFDELLFYFQNGDIQYTRNSSLYQPCVYDACHVCNGNGKTCMDCSGRPGGQKVLDVCGSCSDDNKSTQCSYFCDSIPNSGKLFDLCYKCNGRDSDCGGCDGVIGSGTVYDRCGVCGGNGSSCEQSKGCGTVVCPKNVQIKCPAGKSVTSSGYSSCCFNPIVDCV